MNSAVRVVLHGRHAVSNGLVALIDELDFSFVSQYRWRARKFVSTTGKHYFYAASTIEGKETFLHRLLLGAVRGQFVDHRDHDTMNNCRDNIRICTHAQNMMNRSAFPTNKLGVKGVHFRKDRNNYEAEIMASGKRFRLGCYKTLDEAKAVYDEAAVRLHGEFASL